MVFCIKNKFFTTSCIVHKVAHPFIFYTEYQVSFMIKTYEAVDNAITAIRENVFLVETCEILSLT